MLRRWGLAGAEGFEPSNAGSKVPCLTAWPRPTITHHLPWTGHLPLRQGCPPAREKPPSEGESLSREKPPYREKVADLPASRSTAVHPYRGADLTGECQRAGANA